MTGTTEVETPDGRTLRVHEVGGPEGVPVVVHHGTPATGALYPPWFEDGVRLISFDRAGYGGSTRNPGRRIADVAADVRAIADALELERFATWGISGGGPHALACAALLPDRVFAVAAVCSPAPFDADGLDWFEGQGEGNVAEHKAAAQGEAAVRPLLEEMHAGMTSSGAEELNAELASLLTGPDQEVLTGELAAFLHRSIVDTGGVEGWLDDDLAFVSPWGFDLGSIAVPVLIRHGMQDAFVPFGHSRWLSERIPGSEARITAADGHLTLCERGIPEVHAWLLQDRSDNRRS
jgi:pimeloyl-ACP methyl ester carboxylesterase